MKPLTINRVVAWFSCGAASAVAAKLAIAKYSDKCEVVYCDTSSDEHPDNLRFLADCERWFGRKIIRLQSDYADRWEVYAKTGWLVGPAGARCTTELKKNLRTAYQRWDDVHVLGYTLDERHRVERFEQANPELYTEWPLIDHQLTKQDCYAMLAKAGIKLPAMYALGYANNNCVGCVKGQKGYWNKIRRDFPDVFARMAKEERRLNVAICKDTGPNGERIKVFLDELDPEAGNYEHEPNLSCSIFCQIASEEVEL